MTTRKYQILITSDDVIPQLKGEFETVSDYMAIDYMKSVLAALHDTSWISGIYLHSTSVKDEPGVVTFEFERKVASILIEPARPKLQFYDDTCEVSKVERTVLTKYM